MHVRQQWIAWILAVGGLPCVLTSQNAQGFETPGALYEFDAGQDVPGDDTWTATGLFGFETMTFLNGAMPSAMPVSDGTLNLFAHTAGAEGRSGAYEENLGGASQASRRNASFEVWFKPNNLTTANQIIQETGGSGSGTLISLSSANLEFFVNGTDNLALSTTLTDTNWHQVVGVINNTNDSAANDTLSLYLDGQLLTTSAAANIDDWAGGNQGGIGAFGGSTHPADSQIVSDNGGVPFDGAVHLYRYYDRALTLGDVQTNYNTVINPAAEWIVDAGGNWSNAANWSSSPEVPGVGALSGRDAILGSAISSARTISLDTNVNLSGIKFANDDSYTVAAGGGTLTLSGGAELRVTGGSHTIASPIAGTAGLLKTGAGTIALSGTNTFSGEVDVRGGVLSVSANANLGNATNGITLSGGTLQVTGTSLNTLSRDLSLNAAINVVDIADAANTLEVTGAVSGNNRLTKVGAGTLQLSNAAAFDGELRVNEGVLLVQNAADLGSTVGPTVIGFAGGTVELDGSGGALSLAEDFDFLDGRFAGTPEPHIRNIAGNNTLTNRVNGRGLRSSTVRLENAAEGTTLTFDNTVANPALLQDLQSSGGESIRFVFQGTGNFKIGNEATPGSGRLVGSNVDVVVQLEDATDKVTIATAFASNDTSNAGYTWGGTTTVESGTLEILSDGVLNEGELYSSRIAVREGARFDVSSFSSYSLQITNAIDAIGQELTGSGTIVTGPGTLNAFEDSVFTPGDGVGTLNIDGNLNYSLFASNSNGGLNYELGSTSPAGAGVNDLIAVSNQLALSAASGQFRLNVTPVDGNLATTPYTIMTGGSVTGSATGGSFQLTQLTNPQGTVLNSRQDDSPTFSKSGSAVTVQFSPAASRTWTGSVNSNWDVGGTANWSGGDGLFFDLDDVTFGESGQRSVTVSGAVTSGSVTFNPTSGSYRLAGSGGIQGSGAVNVNSGTVELLNTGNNYSGTTTVAAGAQLTMATATTGAVVNNGTLSVGGAGGAGPNFVTTALQLNYDAALDLPGDATWTDAAPQPGDVDLDFAGAASPVAATDGTFAYLTTAYNIPSSGAALSPGSANGYFDTRAQTGGTFELVFNVTNTAAGEDQVLLDMGGGRGLTLALDNDVLTAGVNGDATDTTAFSTGSLSAGWHHAVIVIGDTDPDNGVDDTFTLYVDNAQVGTSNMVDIDDYSGANGWSVGGPNSATLDPTQTAAGAATYSAANDFAGQIAIARYYQTSFSASQVTQNYLALQDPTQVVGPATLNVDGDFTTAGLLEMDVFGDGATDFIDATGAAVLDGTIDISLVGADPANGQTFTLLTAAEGISLLGSLILPEHFTSAIVDGTSLVLTFNAGLSGDFNGDGVVNLADYTVWRDNLGATEDGVVLNGNGTGDVVDAGDYDLWKSNFGSMSATNANVGAAAVPEPSCLLLAALAGVSVLSRRRLRK